MPSAVIAGASALACFFFACGLLWYGVVLLPQCLLLIAFAGDGVNVTMLARVVAGVVPLGISIALMRSSRMRAAFVRLLAWGRESEQVKKARYFDLALRGKTRELAPALLGAALLISARDMAAAWIRVMPGGAHVWATGVVPLDPSWAAAAVLLTVSGIIALSFLAIGGFRWGLTSAAIGVASFLAFGMFVCTPKMVAGLLSMLFGLQIIGSVFLAWRDEPQGLRVLACCELSPLIAIAASMGERMLRPLVDAVGTHAGSSFALLVAMNGCAALALLLHAFAARKRHGEQSVGKEVPSSLKGSAVSGPAPRKQGSLNTSLEYSGAGRAMDDPDSIRTQLAPYGLSEREMAVLAASLRDVSLASLAEELKVSRSTAGTYRLRAYAKMGVASLEEARALIDASLAEMPHEVPRAEPPVGQFSVSRDRSRLASPPIAILGLTAWFVLVGVLFVPWSGSRAWLLDEAWSALPSVLLVLGASYCVIGDHAQSRNVHLGSLCAASACAALVALLSLFLPGRHVVVDGFPVAFDVLAVVVLAFGFGPVMDFARQVRQGAVGCALFAAAAMSVTSAVGECYAVLIAASAVFLAVLFIGIAHAGLLGDTGSVPTVAYEDRAKMMAQNVGFVPHGEQALCLVAGFSMAGWGLYQINEDTVLGINPASCLSPGFLACSLVLCAGAVVVLWDRFERTRKTSFAIGVAAVWMASVVAAFGLVVLGCDGAPSPVAHLLITFPGTVLAGACADSLLSFQAQYGYASFGFVVPVTILVALSVWCGGSIVADMAKGLTLGALPALCIAIGGFVGFAGLRSAWRTMHKRSALGSAGSEVVTDVLRRAGLTQSEARVALLLCGGLTAREVADRLFVECATVRSHARKIYAKLAVHTRAELEVAVATLVRERVR